MSLYNQILADLKDAMKARDDKKLGVLRMLKASMLEKEISNRSGGEKSELNDEDALSVIVKASKQRKDSITQYRDAGREDLAAIEEQELEIIEGYLPKQLTEDEIATIVTNAIANTGAESMRDMGKVMGVVMPQVKGKADGNLVNRVVKEKLSGQ